MRIATAEVMREIDRYAIEEMGIPGIVLMENAALKVLNHLDLEYNTNFVLVCGTGNNGGDGFAIARHLKVLGKNIKVFLVGDSNKLSGDCRINYNILKNMGVCISKIRNFDDISDLRDYLVNSDVTIDAVFGTGLKRELEELYCSIISIINENSKYIVAIDVPSGMNSNSGKILGNCIKADRTVTFELYKRGFLNYDTDKYLGEIIVEEIGIPEFIISQFHHNEFMVEKHMIHKYIPQRNRYAYKGDYGRTLVVAGSKGFTGAAYIATQAAVKSGAGLVTLACHEDVRDVLSIKLNEAMTANYSNKEDLQEFIDKSNVIAVGPGMGDNDKTLSIVRFIIENAKCPMVIDADGINVLKNHLEILEKKHCPMVFTPHLGEMSRLTGYTIDYIRENRLEVAKEFAQKYDVVVLLKGYHTVVTDGKTTFINPTGNSAMASGGMGDCLTGIIAGFISQAINPLEAAFSAAFIHGYIGDKLSKNMFCVNATQVLNEIPYTIKEIQNS